MELNFAKTRNVKSPKRTLPDAGIDFFVPEDFEKTWLGPAESILIPSGIKADIPEGYALIAFNKSGVSVKKELDVLACVCDAGYQGEIHLNLVNTGNQNISIEPGEKIVQFILLSISNALPKEVKLEELYSRESRRGDGGFGSTGEK